MMPITFGKIYDTEYDATVDRIVDMNKWLGKKNDEGMVMKPETYLKQEFGETDKFNKDWIDPDMELDPNDDRGLKQDLNDIESGGRKASNEGFLSGDKPVWQVSDWYSKTTPFDPEGSGYDMETAKASGLKPDPDTGHWPSRDPKTGLLLKGKTHETWNLLEEGERKAGYDIFKASDGRYYSKPSTKPMPDTPSPQQRLEGAFKGIQNQDNMTYENLRRRREQQNTQAGLLHKIADKQELLTPNAESMLNSYGKHDEERQINGVKEKTMQEAMDSYGSVFADPNHPEIKEFLEKSKQEHEVVPVTEDDLKSLGGYKSLGDWWRNKAIIRPKKLDLVSENENEGLLHKAQYKPQYKDTDYEHMLRNSQDGGGPDIDGMFQKYPSPYMTVDPQDPHVKEYLKRNPETQIFGNPPESIMKKFYDSNDPDWEKVKRRIIIKKPDLVSDADAIVKKEDVVLASYKTDTDFSASAKRYPDGKPMLEAGTGGGGYGGGGSRVIADEIKRPTGYRIVDKHTGKQVGSDYKITGDRHSTVRRRVDNKIDKLDNEYGAYRYRRENIYND